MKLEVAIDWVWMLLLCSMRVAPVLAFTPILRGFSLPALCKVFIVLAVAAAMVPSSQATAPPLPSTALGLAGLAFGEFAVGLVLSVGILAMFGAISLCGRLMDLQAGFGLGAIFDPLTRRPASIMESALGILCVVVFFSLDMHLVTLRMLAESMQSIPLGSSVQAIDADKLVRQTGTMFAMGMAFAAPVVMLLFLFDLGLAVLSRSVPQFNVVFIGVGVKLGLTMLFLSVLALSWGAAFRTLFAVMIG